MVYWPADQQWWEATLCWVSEREGRESETHAAAGCWAQLLHTLLLNGATQLVQEQERRR